MSHLNPLTVPDPVVYTYRFDTVASLYWLENNSGKCPLPELFKIEKIRQTRRITAPLLIRGWKGKWMGKMLTGLDVIAPGLFYGAHEINRKNYLVVILRHEKETAEIYYHKDYYPKGKKALDALNDFYRNMLTRQMVEYYR